MPAAHTCTTAVLVDLASHSCSASALLAALTTAPRKMAFSLHCDDRVATYTDSIFTSSPTTLSFRRADKSTADHSHRWAVDPDAPRAVLSKRQSVPSRKRSFAAQDTIMPVTSGSQSLLASLPTFMSVFGDGSEPGHARVASSPTRPSASSHSASSFSHSRHPSYNSNSLSSPTYRRGSSTTIQSESTESSPTTTISTVDSTLTEQSPSSSPESPNSIHNASSNSSKIQTPHSGDDSMLRQGFSPGSSPGRPGFNRTDSPNKKPRNMKNLSVNTLGANRPSTSSSLPRLASSDTSSTMQDHSHASSAPASPSFVIPFMAPKRKPSNLGLSLTTPDSNPKPLPLRTGFDAVPQTPSFTRLNTLRHVEGVGSLPLFSPIGAPEGGMRLPPLYGSSNGNNSSKPRPGLSMSHHSSFDSSHSSPIVLQTLDHVPEEADHDLPLSREVKSPAYPHGPVCIYPPNVFLYLEPNDVEASEFDVVINVAREVNNPFTTLVEEANEPSTRDVGVQVNLIPELAGPLPRYGDVQPPSAASEKSFQSAFEMIPSVVDDIPDTPKPIKKGPEYIHVPWEHNTKVSLELLELCELIDDRVKRGQRVLIHCQCGVSRSASLIIAYGLYKNPELSDNEAYNAVKERSRWINPNMHFIFELHAFKQMLAEKFPKAIPKRRPGSALGLLRTQTEGVLTRSAYSISAMSPLEEPASAPLQSEFDAMDLSSTTPSSPAPTSGLTGLPSGAELPQAPSSKMLNGIVPSMETSGAHHHQSGSVIVPLLPPPVPRKSLSSMTPDLGTNLSSSNTTVKNEARDLQTLPEPELILLPKSFLEFGMTSPTLIPPLRSQPSLPAGFSSILSRRQGTNQLPLRSESPSTADSIRTMQIPINPKLVDDVPETPSLLSPRALEFQSTPFHRTAAGDLAGSSSFEQALLSPRTAERDPRSPPIKGESPITRNIDDVL
ncbi:hypothetical protein MMC19_001863 [Ptychographa xylographoides]|nr:hypothetical protein [Ptychographa xylographoides]